VRGTLEDKRCEIDVRVQWNNIRKYVAGDLVGTVDKKTREPWITQEMTNKTSE
jgi:hypothetical protein